MEWLEWQKLAGLAITLITAAGGVVGLVGLLKRWIGLDDNTARIASWIVSAIMALLAAVVSGEITPEMFANPVDAAIAIVLILLSVGKFSEGLYKLQKRAGWFR